MQDDSPAPLQQLRIYEIFEPNKQAFHERFRDHTVRIMAKYDFRIVAMWEAKNGARTEELLPADGHYQRIVEAFGDAVLNGPPMPLSAQESIKLCQGA